MKRFFSVILSPIILLLLVAWHVTPASANAGPTPEQFLIYYYTVKASLGDATNSLYNVKDCIDSDDLTRLTEKLDQAFNLLKESRDLAAEGKLEEAWEKIKSALNIINEVLDEINLLGGICVANVSVNLDGFSAAL